MPKKQAKSDRDDLPDWADDVTPTDEVMRKFYAPTGAFKRGPIAVPPPPTTLAFPAPTKYVEGAPPEAAVTDSAPDVQLQATSPQTAPTQDKATFDLPHGFPATADMVATDPSVLEPPHVVADSPEDFAETHIPASSDTHQRRSRGRSKKRAPIRDFEEFASLWKQYLYPGQMSVMKVLFGLTLSVGKPECFVRYSELSVAANMTRRNCINVMNSLVARGFVERVEVRNDMFAKGIRLRVHFELPPHLHTSAQ